MYFNSRLPPPRPGHPLSPWGAVMLVRGQDRCHHLLFVSVPRKQTAQTPPPCGSSFGVPPAELVHSLQHRKTKGHAHCCCFRGLFRNECVCPQTPGLIGKGAQHLGLTRHRRHLSPSPCVWHKKGPKKSSDHQPRSELPGTSRVKLVQCLKHRQIQGIWRAAANLSPPSWTLAFEFPPSSSPSPSSSSSMFKCPSLSIRWMRPGTALVRPSLNSKSGGT